MKSAVIRTSLRLLVGVIVLGATVPVRLEAQEPWRASYFPYFIGGPTDGFMFVGHYHTVKAAPYFITKAGEEIVNPLPYAALVAVEAGIGTLGSRFGSLRFRGPALLKGWRLSADLEARREGRFAFYGTGGDLEAQQDAWSHREVIDPPPPDVNDNFYRVHRERIVARGEVTRSLVGHLAASLATSVDYTRFTPLPATTFFSERFNHAAVSGTDVVTRAGLVFDTRNHEIEPSKGVLLEGNVGFGTGSETVTPLGGGGAYGLGSVNARFYFAPREGTTIGVRGVWREIGGKAPFAARFIIPGWERELTTGGADTHRSFPRGALAGTRVIYSNVEIRHDLLPFGDLGAITAFAFGDLGYAADPKSGFGSTTQAGGGGGVALRILRSAILTMGFAGGKNGFNFSMGTNWAF